MLMMGKSIITEFERVLRLAVRKSAFSPYSEDATSAIAVAMEGGLQGGAEIKIARPRRLSMMSKLDALKAFAAFAELSGGTEN